MEFEKNRNSVKQCPCGKSNSDGKFVPFKGFQDKGYCHSCGKTFTPDQKPIVSDFKPEVNKTQDFIQFEQYADLCESTIQYFPENNFYKWLIDPARGNCAFEIADVQHILYSYYTGCGHPSKYSGWVMFPYIDIHYRVTDVKIMDYDPLTGKRIKEPYARCWFIGKEFLKDLFANLQRCFFGEHLLRDNNKPALIFESEATAVYASLFYPEYICLATGGSNGCKWTDPKKCEVLRGRKIILCPDLDAHESWEQKAHQLRGFGLDVSVSNTIKNNAVKYAAKNAVPFETLVKMKFDMRDILKYKEPTRSVTSPAPKQFDDKKANGLTLTADEAREFIEFCDSIDKEFSFIKK